MEKGKVVVVRVEPGQKAAEEEEYVREMCVARKLMDTMAPTLLCPLQAGICLLGHATATLFKFHHLLLSTLFYIYILPTYAFKLF